MKSWLIKSSKLLFENRWIRLLVDNIASPNSPASYNYTYISRLQSGVAVVPFFSRINSFLLVNQYRHPIRKSIWQFPGGGQEKGQSALETAQKELLEETGYSCEQFIDLGLYYPDAGIMANNGKFYIALDPIESQKVKLDPLELTHSKIVSIENFKNMIQKEQIRDGWTLSAYLLFDLWLHRK